MFDTLVYRRIFGLVVN